MIVLRVTLPYDGETICFADDTIVIISGESIELVKDHAEEVAVIVINEIEKLGLKVAHHKTEAVLFAPRGLHPIMEHSIKIGNQFVKLACSMEYLVVVIDCRWKYEEHVKRAAVKADKVGMALSRLMPNVRGPSEEVRKLYSNVVRSTFLYAVSSWKSVFSRRRAIWNEAIKVNRKLAIRIISGYRTVSDVAAGLLSRSPPIDILAKNYAWLYDAKRSIKNNLNKEDAKKHIGKLKRIMRMNISKRWLTRLTNEGLPSIELRKVFVSGDTLNKWIKRKHGKMSFRLTQLLTGHGCFAAFTYKINKSDSPICILCKEGIDNVEHVLQLCNEFEEHRMTLAQVIGRGNLTVKGLIGSMLGSQIKWQAVYDFAETVMKIKEEAENKFQKEGLYAVDVIDMD